jgi:hypothetical protein
MEVNGKVLQASYTTKPDWYEKDGDTYYYNTDYNYDLATALPASKALQITSALIHTDLTEMSYFVEGTISNMRNTATQIAQYKTARFDISDDGSTNNQFYCYNTKWIGDTEFVTGNEIKREDKVIILGQLQNYNGNTPEIKGYVYDHTAGPGHTTDIEKTLFQEEFTIHDIMGRKWNNANQLPLGIYLINGKKVFIGR